RDLGDLSVAMGASVARRRDQAIHRPDLEPPAAGASFARHPGCFCRAHLTSSASDLPPTPNYAAIFRERPAGRAPENKSAISALGGPELAPRRERTDANPRTCE